MVVRVVRCHLGGWCHSCRNVERLSFDFRRSCRLWCGRRQHYNAIKCDRIPLSLTWGTRFDHHWKVQKTWNGSRGNERTSRTRCKTTHLTQFRLSWNLTAGQWACDRVRLFALVVPWTWRKLSSYNNIRILLYSIFMYIVLLCSFQVSRMDLLGQHAT